MFYSGYYFNAALALVFLACLILAVLSLWWTSRHERGILRRALGRKVHEADETSLKTWMKLPDRQLAEAEQELARNPFDRPLDVLEDVGDQLTPGPKDQ